MGLCGLGLLYSPLWRFNVKSQCGSPEIPSSHEAILSRYRGDRAWGVAGAAIERPHKGGGVLSPPGRSSRSCEAYCPAPSGRAIA